MKLKIPELDGPVELSVSHVTSIACEDPSSLRRMIESIRMACDGLSDDAFLWDGCKETSLSHKVEIIYYPSLIDFNSRKIQTALIRKIKLVNSIEISKADIVDSCISSLRKAFDEVLEQVGLDYSSDDVNDTSSLLKFLNISLEPDVDNLCDRMKDYIRLCSVLDMNDYLFCLNFKSIFTKSELEEIELCAIQNGIYLVLFDCASVNIDRSEHEQGIVMTRDYDIALIKGNDTSPLEYVFD